MSWLQHEYDIVTHDTTKFSKQVWVLDFCRIVSQGLDNTQFLKEYGLRDAIKAYKFIRDALLPYFSTRSEHFYKSVHCYQVKRIRDNKIAWGELLIHTKYNGTTGCDRYQGFTAFDMEKFHPLIVSICHAINKKQKRTNKIFFQNGWK